MKQQYIGTKIIDGEPACNAEGQPGYEVLYENGYKSWSPQEAFDKAYVSVSAMTFGQALEAARLGYAVRRPGWADYQQVRHSDSIPSVGLLGYLMTNDPECQTPISQYLPLTEEMSATDWRIVELSPVSPVQTTRFQMTLQGSSLK